MVRIAVIGGGIGGLTVALALQQAGFQCDVYEQAPELRNVGAAIAIWPNAMRVLEHLKIADGILEKAGVMEKIRWLDQHGRLINEVSIPDTAAGRRFPAVALHRADLQSTLVHSVAPSSLHLGHALADFSLAGDKLVAKFTSGHAIVADFLIAADGVHSRARAQLLRDAEPIDRGYTVWRGIAPISPAAIPAATAIELQGAGKRFGVGPVGLGRLGWWATANSAETDDLRRLFQDWYLPVRQLIEATPASSILKTGACDRAASQTWGWGRMTLLGDAIHPTTPNLGQGGCLAMEDALVLARCFEKYGAVTEALRKYENCRYKRTTAVSRYSRYYGQAGQWQNVFARVLRRTTLSLVPEAVAQRLMQIVFNYDATKVPL